MRASSVNASPRRQVFLESTFSYRTPMCLGLGLLFTASGSYVLFLAVREFQQGGFVWQWSVGIVVGPIWIACMLFFGGWSLHRFFFAPVLCTRLDETGLTMGVEHWSWPEIGWIGGRVSKAINNRGVCLVFQARSKWPFAGMRPVIMNANSSDEYDDLIGRLEEFLAEHYPAVAVG
jgi:hypothetical protein